MNQLPCYIVDALPNSLIDTSWYLSPTCQSSKYQKFTIKYRRSLPLNTIDSLPVQVPYKQEYPLYRQFNAANSQVHFYVRHLVQNLRS